MRGHIVKVVLSEEEYERLKGLAGREAVSAYCRRVLLAPGEAGEPDKEEKRERKKATVDVGSNNTLEKTSNKPLWKGKEGRLI